MKKVSAQQRILTKADRLLCRTAAGVLFKYTDDEGNSFFLPEKKTGTLKSPYSGKSLTARPEKSSLTEVGKGLKEDEKKANLFKYTDEEGKVFFLPEKKTGTLKSPYSGKSLKAVSEKETLSEVSKGLKTAGVTGESMAATQELLDKGLGHPAFAILDSSLSKLELEWSQVKMELAEAQRAATSIGSQDGAFFKQTIAKVEDLSEAADRLARHSAAITKQLKVRLL